jgi:hypothetical protein
MMGLDESLDFEHFVVPTDGSDAVWPPLPPSHTVISIIQRDSIGPVLLCAEEHTNNMNISTGGSQEIEKKDYKQQDSPSLYISRALTLSHPGDFEVIQDACAVD